MGGSPVNGLHWAGRSPQHPRPQLIAGIGVLEHGLPIPCIVKTLGAR